MEKPHIHATRLAVVPRLRAALRPLGTFRSATTTAAAALTIAAVMTFIAVLASCAGSCTPMPRNIIATDKDNGKTFEIFKGSLAEIRLAGNPTTGYMWNPSSDSDNDLVMKSLDLAEDRAEGLAYGSYIPSKSKLIGSGGTFVFKFMAANPGEATLVFAYARSWETKAPAQTFRIRIKVKDVH